MAPASDMGWSAKTMAESFYYSNISPQLPAFNRGGWKRLEEQVRVWAAENETIYVVTGPILYDGLKTIGTNKITVSDYFYKVVLDYAAPDIKGIAFIMPNTQITAPIQQFAVSIDSIEKINGIEFFLSCPMNNKI